MQLLSDGSFQQIYVDLELTSCAVADGSGAGHTIKLGCTLSLQGGSLAWAPDTGQRLLKRLCDEDLPTCINVGTALNNNLKLPSELRRRELLWARTNH